MASSRNSRAPVLSLLTGTYTYHIITEWGREGEGGREGDREIWRGHVAHMVGVVTTFLNEKKNTLTAEVCVCVCVCVWSWRRSYSLDWTTLFEVSPNTHDGTLESLLPSGPSTPSSLRIKQGRSNLTQHYPHNYRDHGTWNYREYGTWKGRHSSRPIVNHLTRCQSRCSPSLNTLPLGNKCMDPKTLYFWADQLIILHPLTLCTGVIPSLSDRESRNPTRTPNRRRSTIEVVVTQRVATRPRPTPLPLLQNPPYVNDVHNPYINIKRGLTELTISNRRYWSFHLGWFYSRRLSSMIIIGSVSLLYPGVALETEERWSLKGRFTTQKFSTGWPVGVVKNVERKKRVPGQFYSQV